MQCVEEDFPQLGIGVDVELLAGLGVDFLFDAKALALEAFLQCPEPFDVDCHSLPFHLREHADEWHLDIAKQARELQRFQLRLEDVAQLPCNVRVFTRVVARTVDWDLIVWDGLFAATTQLRQCRHCTAEELESELVDAVGTTTGVEHVARNHCIEGQAAQVDAGSTQDEDVELGVLKGLRYGLILEERAQWRHGGIRDRRKIADAFSFGARKCSRRNARGLWARRGLPARRPLSWGGFVLGSELLLRSELARRVA